MKDKHEQYLNNYYKNEDAKGTEVLKTMSTQVRLYKYIYDETIYKKIV